MNKSHNLLTFKALLISTLLFSFFSCSTKEEASEEKINSEDTVSTSSSFQIDSAAILEKEKMEAIAHTSIDEVPNATTTQTVEGSTPSTTKSNKAIKSDEKTNSPHPVISYGTTGKPGNKDDRDDHPIAAKVVEETFTHAIFDDLLKKYVSTTGKVNYNGFKTERAKLQSYLVLLKNNEPKSTWSRNEKLAYWINTYNAFTIELILKNNQPKSIMDINNGKAWDLKFAEIGSSTFSLNNIEHDIIRKQFSEPRIHFACVCAAKSCPKLLNQAYTEDNINAKLDDQTRNFINNPERNQIADGNLKVSELFNWYASDFGEVNGYIRKYSTKSFKDDKKIEYLPYDWSLNN